MEAGLRALVWRRAASRCEYCQMPQAHDGLTFEVEHVRPRKHGGLTVAENLSLACFPCNRFKGPNLAGIDPDTGDVIPLFNPRIDRWNEHFTFDRALIHGITPKGRATVIVLRMNEPMRAALRQIVMELGEW
jgi:hypothetical protein